MAPSWSRLGALVAPKMEPQSIRANVNIDQKLDAPWDGTKLAPKSMLTSNEVLLRITSWVPPKKFVVLGIQVGNQNATQDKTRHGKAGQNGPGFWWGFDAKLGRGKGAKIEQDRTGQDKTSKDKTKTRQGTGLEDEERKGPSERREG